MSAQILYPQAVSHLDAFMVCRVSDGAIVQGEYDEACAGRSASILNEHNATHGHAERFIVKPRSEVFEEVQS